TRVQQSPFRFPALASEDQTVAFLEPEVLRGASGTDLNGDGDVDDTILHAFHVASGSATDVTGGRNIAVHPSLVVTNRSLAVSNGLVFFRTAEAATAGRTTSRVAQHVPDASEDHGGGSGLSADGRFVVFASDATDLVPGDTNGVTDVF